ncbi:MAG: outer membrane receptor protein [Muricauda sp.]|nr:outer membrane receptor protein [Allomuricauda sp.]
MNLALLALTITAGAIVTSPLQAQDLPSEAEGPVVKDPANTIVVTGTRSAGRSALEAAVPVDVVSEEELNATGYADLNRALNFLEPSVNSPRAATTATAANTRPITLRGLSPDQTLVLVNGKRRHTNAVLNVNNSIGRGSAGVDLDTIPQNAIQRIEILRDGAAAQYGSDAIGGVVNIILKDDAQGASFELLGGITEEGDGLNGLASTSGGLPIGRGGHLTLSALVRAQEATNRAFVDQRFDRVTYRIGDPEASLFGGSVNFGLPLGDAELYGFGTVAQKISNNGAGFRVPGTSLLYPDGFLPVIEPYIWDGSGTLGISADLGGFALDLSQTYGRNEADFRVFDTVNVSLGLDSPTSFDSGGVTYEQYVTDFGVSRSLGLLAGGNITAGAQYRRETYAIREGEPAASTGVGADGFAGFAPRRPVNEVRDAFAFYLDAELRPIEALLIGGAVRYDEYDDSGGETTWRVSARADLTEGLALRGAIGTAFRAPSLQQQNFSAVQGALSAGQLVSVATLPVSDPIARALGAGDLRPERSRNYSAGIVLEPTPRLAFTLDAFHIQIDDRIALSEQLRGAAVNAILAGAGIVGFSQVRFFTNAVDTRTTGVEATARWSASLSPETRASMDVGFALYDTELESLRANPVLPTLPLLGEKSILFLTEAQPRDKLTVQAVVEHRSVSARAALTRFGTYTSQPLVETQTFDGGTSFDLSLSYALSSAIMLTAGVQNLFDDRPEEIADQARFIAATGGSFPTGEETPLGVNGRSYFVQLRGNF